MQALKFVILSITIFLLSACESKDVSLNTNETNSIGFEKIEKERSGINFINKIQENLTFNFLSYPYIYNGAGVATGDLNNDGLIDIYFTSNQGPNRLYINQGDFNFKDQTTISGTSDSDGFSTGVTMMDINNDGWLDIYICKAASLENNKGRRNKLFINNQDGTFTESANQWGIADSGFSTQAYTLDYDKDGDLDLYIVNYRADFKNNSKISGAIQNKIETVFSDQLYRNNGQSFTNVTAVAGVANKAWGLGAAIGDYNGDTYPDIYVSNDYLEPDMLYINQKDGTFKNEVLEMMNHLSFYSMGIDRSDVNNDGVLDHFVVDMAAEDHERSKENMATMSTSNFESMVDIGYHHQYMSNMLQIGVGDGTFIEASQLSGISKTDWSWAPLIADLDNDGLKDIYITNGVYKDITNQDFRGNLKKINDDGIALTLEALQDLIPGSKLSNYVYRNKGDLSFNNEAQHWNLDTPSHSNGSSYADFDNDGDLDLVVNNIMEQAHIYRNNSQGNYIDIALKGPKENILGIGTQIKITTKEVTQFQELYLSRGFESSVAPRLHFGLGLDTEIEHLEVTWPDGKITILENIIGNQILEINYDTFSIKNESEPPLNSQWTEINPSSLKIDYKQEENDVNDYAVQLLLPHKKSTTGSPIVTSDVNNDGLEDFFVGNAKGAAGAIYLQQAGGTFKKSNISLLAEQAKYEDTGATFFDADGDGDQDLYVVSGGYELAPNSLLLQDRLFINNGKGDFKLSNNLPQMNTAGKSITTADYDQDGDIDIFVGGYVIPGRYPEAPRSYLLENKKGVFTDITAQKAIGIMQAAMVSDALFTDYDSDGDLDLITVGEWSPVRVYENNGGAFAKANTSSLEGSSGWWQSISATDIDNDGDDDYILGNIGGNNKFHPSKEKPLHIYAKDFDDNGSFDIAMSKENKGKLVPIRGKECSSEQNPFLLEKIGTYKEFATNDMAGIYGEDKLANSLHLITETMQSALLINNGKGSFEIKNLPNATQAGPTLKVIAQLDLNGDDQKDIIGLGAIYDAEVETVRYDSNFGYSLTWAEDHLTTLPKEYQHSFKGDFKDITSIAIHGKLHLLATRNNGNLKILRLERPKSM